MKPKDAALLTTVAPTVAAAPPVGFVLLILGAGLLWLLSRKDETASEPVKVSTPSANTSDATEPKPVIAAPSATIPVHSSAPPVSMSSQAKSNLPRAALSAPSAKRVTREDLAEALDYGAKRLTRRQAVVGLEALGFRKTAAYKALAEDGKFASLIEFTPDGLRAAGFREQDVDALLGHQ